MTNKATILLIEDNLLDIELTKEAFRDATMDVTVNVVNNGRKALSYLLGTNEFIDRKKYPLPDLVLLDLKMPEISGHEVLRKAKSTKHLKHIPFIVLTSSKERLDIYQSYEQGANSYIHKPISYEGFLAVVEQINAYWLALNVPPLGLDDQKASESSNCSS